MEALKTLAKTQGNAIQAVLMPSIQAFVPLLLSNKTSILSTPRTTYSYGSHARQKLDHYPSSSGPSSPTLIFFYGGGLIRGDKILPMVPEGLIYHNLGHFFAQRGITTLIADYRRVNSSFGGEDAVFPSGGEDVAAVLKWLGSEEGEKEVKGDRKNVYLMGNSAGGLHIATFLLSPHFLSQRKALHSGTGPVQLKGAIEIGVPFGFDQAADDRQDMLVAYYGSIEEAREKCPTGLLKAVEKEGKSKEELGVPKLLFMVSENDPEDEILAPNREFVGLVEKVWAEKGEVREIEGHNHISPLMALGSGEGEKWGEELAAWVKG
ncbi:carboxylesterase type b protein [Rutstroemia sp. NJR-2017a BBW]|nr:carboxylesterase type b protein [Rutstroemia sp. NJR-2017a BBW]